MGAGLGLGRGQRRGGAGPEASLGRRRDWRERGGASDQSRRSWEVTSPRGQSVYATAVHWDGQAVATEGCLTPDHPAGSRLRTVWAGKSHGAV